MKTIIILLFLFISVNANSQYRSCEEQDSISREKIMYLYRENERKDSLLNVIYADHRNSQVPLINENLKLRRENKTAWWGFRIMCAVVIIVATNRR
jgi:hypothetical protein